MEGLSALIVSFFLLDSKESKYVTYSLNRPSHADLGQKELTNFCRERLAAYQAPKRWRFMEQLPRNAMGKLNKKELIKEILAAEC